jgi:hypothetical protein
MQILLPFCGASFEILRLNLMDRSITDPLAL